MRGVTDLKCILVIDESTKDKMNHNIADLAGYGVDIIENIRCITKGMLKRTRRVILLGSFRFDGLDDLKIHKDLLNLEYFLITDDQLMADLMIDFCKCFVMNYKSLNSNMIYSIIYDDKGEQSLYRPAEDYLTPKDEVDRILETSGEPLLRGMCMDYIRLRDVLTEKLKKENSYVKTIRSLESQNLQHLGEIELISSSLTHLVAQSLEQNEILKEHKIAFSPDFYDKVYLSSGKYVDRPKILYFKEYEEIIHESSFFNTLFTTFSEQGKLATKIVRLHDSLDIMRIKKLEKTYYPINGEFLESKVVEEDYIISFGNYKRLLDFLLTNKYKLDLLIIIDCKKFNDVVLEGDRIAFYYLCRNIAQSKDLHLNELRTISNNNDSSMSWNTITNFNEMNEDPENKFRFLASREPIKRIFTTIKNLS